MSNKVEEIMNLIGDDSAAFMETVVKAADKFEIDNMSFKKLKKGNIKLTVTSKKGVYLLSPNFQYAGDKKV